MKRGSLHIHRNHKMKRMLQTNDGETYWKPFEHSQNINLNKALKNSIAKTMNLYRLLHAHAETSNFTIELYEDANKECMCRSL